MMIKRASPRVNRNKSCCSSSSPQRKQEDGRPRKLVTSNLLKRIEMDSPLHKKLRKIPDTVILLPRLIEKNKGYLEDFYGSKQ